MTEKEMDRPVLALFDRLRIEAIECREWLANMIRLKTQDGRHATEAKIADINRQLTLARHQQEQLVNMRLAQEVDGEVFASKSLELVIA